MNIEQLEKNADAAAELLNAMANANRLAILCNLVEGEKPVTELVELGWLKPTCAEPTLSQVARIEAGNNATRRKCYSLLAGIKRS